MAKCNLYSILAPFPSVRRRLDSSGRRVFVCRAPLLWTYRCLILEAMPKLRSIGANFDIAATILLAAAIVPAFRAAGLPLRFDWAGYVDNWVGLTIQALMAAFLFCLIQWPRALLQFVSGLHKGNQSLAGQSRAFGRACASVLLPAAYLFLSGILIFAYNYVIVSFRYYGEYDAAMIRLDSWLLGGATVSGIAHWASAHFPLVVFRGANFVYFAMFSQVGACIILLGLKCGKSHSMQYIKSVVTAYYLALLIFAILPVTGPFLTRPNPYPEALRSTPAYVYQKDTLAQLDHIWNHRSMAEFGIVYFIGLPSLHIAQPVIMLWYVRRWKRIAVVMAIFDVLLIPSIVLLEQHYVVDLLGGFAVGVLAIVMLRAPNEISVTREVRDSLASREPAVG